MLPSWLPSPRGTEKYVRLPSDQKKIKVYKQKGILHLTPQAGILFSLQCRITMNRPKCPLTMGKTLKKGDSYRFGRLRRVIWRIPPLEKPDCRLDRFVV